MIIWTFIVCLYSKKIIVKYFGDSEMFLTVRHDNGYPMLKLIHNPNRTIQPCNQFVITGCRNTTINSNDGELCVIDGSSLLRHECFGGDSMFNFVRIGNYHAITNSKNECMTVSRSQQSDTENDVSFLPCNFSSLQAFDIEVLHVLPNV